jgi:hypothetical protein
MPFVGEAARAIVAATAAHWFHRPAFYGEVRRVLVPGGVIAIVEGQMSQKPALRRPTELLEESAARADEFAAAGDHDGAATWRRITDAVVQLANENPAGPVH